MIFMETMMKSALLKADGKVWKDVNIVMKMRKVRCAKCNNIFEIDTVMDVVECPFCGINYKSHIGRNEHLQDEKRGLEQEGKKQSFVESLRNPVKNEADEARMLESHVNTIMRGIEDHVKHYNQTGKYSCKGYVIYYDTGEECGLGELTDYESLPLKSHQDRCVKTDSVILIEEKDINKYLAELKKRIKDLGFENFVCKAEYRNLYNCHYVYKWGNFVYNRYVLKKELQSSGYAIYIELNW